MIRKQLNMFMSDAIFSENFQFQFAWIHTDPRLDTEDQVLFYFCRNRCRLSPAIIIPFFLHHSMHHYSSCPILIDRVRVTT